MKELCIPFVLSYYFFFPCYSQKKKVHMVAQLLHSISHNLQLYSIFIQKIR